MRARPCGGICWSMTRFMVRPES